jgi:hypothetical protein
LLLPPVKIVPRAGGRLEAELAGVLEPVPSRDVVGPSANPDYLLGWGTVHDEIRQAYATLELAPGASLDEVKARHKTLVRTWHPDRYQSDPIGQAEALQQMRNINHAYQVLEGAISSSSIASETPSGEGSIGTDSERSPNQGDTAESSTSDLLDSFSVRLPRMSWGRGLSLGTVAAYLVLATTVLPGDPSTRGYIGRYVGRALGYFWLPLYLIWGGQTISRVREARILFQIIGWILLAAPGVVGLVWWAANP